MGSGQSSSSDSDIINFAVMVAKIRIRKLTMVVIAELNHSQDALWSSILSELSKCYIDFDFPYCRSSASKTSVGPTQQV